MIPGGATTVETPEAAPASRQEEEEYSELWAATRIIVRSRREGRCLVPFHPEGSRPPLFILPGRSGKVTAYVKYRRHLGPDQPFYSLEPPGMDGSRALRSRIEDLATDYLEEVAEVQPSGPYHLAGFCAGGVIAFEMAQQLRARGEEVATLVLIDAWNPRHAKWRLAFRRFRKQLGRRGSVQAKVRYLLGWVGRGLRWALLHPLRKPFRRRRQPLPRPLRYHNVAQAIQDANDYRPRPYPGSLVLLRGWDLRPGGGIREDLGWGGIARGGVEVQELPADHSDFTAGPEVIQVVSRRLRQIIDRSLDRS